MSFTQAVSRVFRQYAGFRGRARRAEYWWFALFVLLVTFVAAIIDDAVLRTSPEADMGPVQAIVWFVLLLPALAVTVRRLHDTNRSGWWLLGCVVPILGFVVFVFLLLDSNPHANRFGPSPKHPTVAAGQTPGMYGPVADDASSWGVDRRPLGGPNVADR